MNEPRFPVFTHGIFTGGTAMRKEQFIELVFTAYMKGVYQFSSILCI
jgi:hypothetical protein